jgi:CelD/BcsL family acetyltransferase involved in cellulose biosynthesis
MDSPFRVEIASSWDAVAPRWAALQGRGVGTPFQHAHWMATWYGVFGALPEIEPVLVAVNDARSSRDMLLIPLVRRMVGSLRVIEFADLWSTDYNAPLIGDGAPSEPAECALLWAAVLQALPPADLVRFTKMPLAILGRQNPLALLPDAHASATSGYIVRLPECWDDYIKSLKKDMQSLLRRRWKRFAEEANGVMRWVKDEAEARRVLTVLQEQQTARLRQSGVSHVFDDPHHVRFYERHVLEGLADGTAVLTALVAEDEIVATFLAVADGRCCTLIRSSQHSGEKWLKLGPGKLIIERSMHALHQRGYRMFDLSIGDSPYKHDFGVEPFPLAELEMALTWRAIPMLYRERTWANVKRNPWVANAARSVKRVLPVRHAAGRTRS